ncbi:MAG: FAD-dependent oxidoreductase [Lentisphaerota bacterium]
MQNAPTICDVLIIGAGPAGCAAALAAVETGARVILAERENHLGGTVEHAQLTTFCGFFKNDSSAPELLNPHGISLAITEELKAVGYKPVKYGRVWLQPFPKNFLHDFFISRINAASSLKFWPQSTVNKFIIDENTISDVHVSSASSQWQIKPRTVIDCTGNGTLPHNYYNVNHDSLLQQGAALTFLIRNSIRLDKITNLELLYKIKKSINSGKLSDTVAVTSFENGFAPREIIGRVNLPEDTPKEQLETMLQHDIQALENYLRQDMAGFENAEIIIPRAKLSHRIGLRIHGEYELSEQDLINGRTFEDGYIKAAWPIEEWNAKGQSLHYLSSAYEIPDRSFISSQCCNLFAGGGTISSTAQAHASARVCGTAFASGERAGHLATVKFLK